MTSSILSATASIDTVITKSFQEKMLDLTAAEQEAAAGAEVEAAAEAEVAAEVAADGTLSSIDVFKFFPCQK